jgi:hypothetical protein
MTALPSQFGGKAASPPYDEDLPGYSGNYSAADVGADLYPVRFTAVVPEIERVVRDNIDAVAVAAYEINIPNDLLEIVVP